MFDPKTKKYPYPEYTDGHYLKVKNDNGLVFDKNYPFIDNSKSFKFKRFWYYLFHRLIIVPVVRIRLGLKVKGRKNLKKYKSVIKNGIVSCCNHIHLWDYLGITHAVRYYKPKYLVWDKNVKGLLGKPIRLLGGIPLPIDDIPAQIAYSRCIKKHLNNGGWLHIYSEGSSWEFYKPIRPFKRGAASYALMCDKPILPMAYTYRKPNWIRRKIFKQIATLTLNIGEPIYINKELPKGDQENDLTIRAHEAVCRLANIDPKDNIYPAIYDNTRRIDYY